MIVPMLDPVLEEVEADIATVDALDPEHSLFSLLVVVPRGIKIMDSAESDSGNLVGQTRSSAPFIAIEASVASSVSSS